MKNLYRLLITLLLLFLITSTSLADEEKQYDHVCKKYDFSIQEEIEIGFQSALALIKQYGHLKDPAINQYISNIGESIAKKVSHRPLIKYRFIVLDTDEINAFAAPGGFIFITKGTLKLLDNEAELAAVLAHEITHVEEGHGLDAISSDPSLKENINITKELVGTKECLSNKLMKLLDNNEKDIKNIIKKKHNTSKI